MVSSAGWQLAGYAVEKIMFLPPYHHTATATSCLAVLGECQWYVARTTCIWPMLQDTSCSILSHIRDASKLHLAFVAWAQCCEQFKWLVSVGLFARHVCVAVLPSDTRIRSKENLIQIQLTTLCKCARTCNKKKASCMFPGYVRSSCEPCPPA